MLSLSSKESSTGSNEVLIMAPEPAESLQETFSLR